MPRTVSAQPQRRHSSVALVAPSSIQHPSSHPHSALHSNHQLNQTPATIQSQQKEDGRDPLQWDDDDLLRVRDLHSRSFANQSEFLAAKNLADYLGLGEVEQVHLALPLHVVFVGFMGDGNQRVRVDELTLTEWFAHLDHVLPHARVSLADLTCLEDGHCAGFAAGTADASPLLPSAARLNFSCNVVAVQKAEVLAAYERAVAAFSRPVDPDFETGAQQVRARVLGW